MVIESKLQLATTSFRTELLRWRAFRIAPQPMLHMENLTEGKGHIQLSVIITDLETLASLVGAPGALAPLGYQEHGHGRRAGPAVRHASSDDDQIVRFHLC